MPIHELVALGAATCWAFTGLIAAGPSGHLGAPAFNRVRQVFVTGLLALYVILTGSWRQLDEASVGPLLLSGLIGIFIGDTLLFAALNRLGPRRAGILFALNAPIASLLGWLVLGEALSISAVAGIALTAAGVFLAIVFGKSRSQIHQWERIKGPLWIGVLLGLGAATGQAVGSIIARPVMVQRYRSSRRFAAACRHGGPLPQHPDPVACPVGQTEGAAHLQGRGPVAGHDIACECRRRQVAGASPVRLRKKREK